MNRLMKLLLLLAVFSCSNATRDEVYLFSYFKGNGEDGLHLAWSEDGLTFSAINNDNSVLKPEVSSDKLMRDPCIIRGADGKYHMVWTVSWNDRGIGYASSADLINWSEQKLIPVMGHEPTARNCWAPEVFYDKSSKNYIIFWSTTIPGLFPETEAMADRGWDHRMYYVTTRDFETFSETKEFYNHGFNVIDGSLVEHNRTYYLFLKDETRYPPQKNIRLATASSVEGPYTAASEPITGDYWAEGPTAIKVGEEWVVYFDKYMDHRMGAVSSPDLQNWTDISDSIIFPEGTRHGTVIKVSRKVLDKLLAHFGS
jgi:beta-xylosidase